MLMWWERTEEVYMTHLTYLKWNLNITFLIMKYLVLRFPVFKYDWQDLGKSHCYQYRVKSLDVGFGLWCLALLSTIFRLFRGGQFYLMEETEVPSENHRPVASHWQTSFFYETQIPWYTLEWNFRVIFLVGKKVYLQ